MEGQPVTFKEIVDAVLSDRFGESKRLEAKNWVNHRYWWLWSLEEWPFKFATDAVTVTSGSQIVTGAPTDLKTAFALYSDSGRELQRVRDHRDFFNAYQGQPAGTPEAFTTFGTSLLVGPTPNTTSAAYTLLYEKEVTLLSADSDLPAFPAGSHFALVHGGSAEGLKLQNDPTWQAFENDFRDTITILREAYMATVGGSGYQMPAYRPGS